MTKGERVKEVRKSLGLTLEKFGEKLGVQKSAVSKIERGDTNLTDQVAKSICREFSVDYEWLTTGEGEMFLTVYDDFTERFHQIMDGDNETHKHMLHVLLHASDEDIACFQKFFDAFASKKD